MIADADVSFLVENNMNQSLIIYRQIKKKRKNIELEW